MNLKTLQMKLFFILFILINIFVIHGIVVNDIYCDSSANISDTFISEKYGRSIAELAANNISDSGIFPNDHGILRRIAIVESNDGIDSNTFRTGSYGGIWQVDENEFLETQNISRHATGLPKIHDKIEQVFHIKWGEVVWQDLRKPYYSALASRISLYLKEQPIPKNLNDQANYWKQYYNTNHGKGKASEFIERVNRVEQPCTIGYWNDCTKVCGEIHHGNTMNHNCNGGCRKCDGICFECNTGYWGDKCENRCGEIRIGNTASYHCDGGCDKQSGICFKCDNGFWGSECKERCGTTQTIGKYGCDGYCDKTNGNCPKCSLGYWGENCDKECPSRCKTVNQKTCEKSSGNCFICDTGYSGQTCSNHI